MTVWLRSAVKAHKPAYSLKGETRDKRPACNLRGETRDKRLTLFKLNFLWGSNNQYTNRKWIKG